MKRLQQTLVSLVAVMALGLAGAMPASAVEECSIENTGPGSTNECTSESGYVCTVDNNNNVTVTDNNNQNAVSGTGTVSNNTTGGGASTGTASNSNGTVFSVSVTNNACAVLSVSVPPKPTPKPVPAAKPGMGAVKQSVAAPVQKPAPMLANTAGDNTAGIITGVLAVTAAVLAAVRFGTTTYARRQHK